ncbi:hypothetical protein Atai01_45220 [Amycolatopsis taiwanensis]|uniref:Uncharacterized protein n=1 Tax=Amycolatopsis taiwanensis TaxID=342230 RepID=A0A9W6R3K5_9PSEU|nr:hypothetical protein Atai01_45220 [Amycolatopsis taiwanensis]
MIWSRASAGTPSSHRGPEALTRELIEVHLAHLAERFPNPKGRTGQLSNLAGLLRAACQHGWESRLSAQVDLFPEDYPRLVTGPPRSLSKAVMAQLEHPDNLARFAAPSSPPTILIWSRHVSRQTSGR